MTKRHDLVVRITHRVNALALAIMVGSGLPVTSRWCGNREGGHGFHSH